MNAGTLSTITSVLGMINPALGVIGSFASAFSGAAKVTAITSQVSDAIKVATSLMPLVSQFGRGEEVTPEDVRAALDGFDDALADFDRKIAASKA